MVHRLPGVEPCDFAEHGARSAFGDGLQDALIGLADPTLFVRRRKLQRGADRRHETVKRESMFCGEETGADQAVFARQLSPEIAADAMQRVAERAVAIAVEQIIGVRGKFLLRQVIRISPVERGGALQQGGIDGIARSLVEQPAMALMQQAGMILQTRVAPEKREALRYATLDSTVALMFALFINASILILAAAAFYTVGENDVAEIDKAHLLLEPLLGSSLAPIRVKIRSTLPITALVAGTKLPTCAKSTISATWRM